MILRREQLGKHPSVFRALTGLTVEAFDPFLPEGLAAFAADRRRRLDRPDRRRAVGGGDDFDLAVADQFLLTLVRLRHDPTQECPAASSASRTPPPCAPSAAASPCCSGRARTPGACPTLASRTPASSPP